MGRTNLQQSLIYELGILLAKCEMQGALLFFLYIVCTYGVEYNFESRLNVQSTYKHHCCQYNQVVEKHYF